MTNKIATLIVAGFLLSGCSANAPEAPAPTATKAAYVLSANDQAFVKAVRPQLLQAQDSTPTQLVATGKQVCALMEKGMTADAIVASEPDKSEGGVGWDVYVLTVESPTYYCPEFA